jgi:hypothetical protein
MSQIQLTGAASFGAVLGWYIYYINRNRKSDVQMGDLVTLVGALGGTVILSLYPQGTDLLGAYGLGLAIGFFGYFLALIVLVRLSKNFDIDWFLDGRRTLPDGTIFVPQVGTPAAGGIPMAPKEPPAGMK